MTERTAAICKKEDKYMKKVLALGFLLGTALAVGTPAFAQDQHTVKFNLDVNQPTLFSDDDKLRDTFKGSVDDDLGITSLNVTCSAGAKGTFGIGRRDETCAVVGTGIIRNPANPSQTLKRATYNGAFVVNGKEDGYVDLTSINVNYEGPAAPPNTTFGGSVSMKPENPSAGALELAGNAFDYLKKKTAGSSVEVDTAFDSINYNGVVVPHTGQKDAQSCKWSGNDLYLYANAQWQQKFPVTCGDQTYVLEGNMALVDTPAGSQHQHEYLINLILGGADGTGGDPFAAADPFAVVPGITGSLRMTDSGRVTEDGVAENIVVAGELVGNGVPMELTHSLGELIIVFGRAKFGE